MSRHWNMFCTGANAAFTLSNLVGHSYTLAAVTLVGVLCGIFREWNYRRDGA